MADNSTKRMQSYVELLKSKSVEFRSREKVWHSLANYIHASGGWCTSNPGNFSYMRAEILPGSEIPIRLAERGSKLSFLGSPATRITGGNIVPVDIIEITLGK